MELLVFAIAIVFFLWLKARLSVDSPGGTQQFMEALLTNSMGVGVKDLLDDLVGHGGGNTCHAWNRWDCSFCFAT